MKRIILASSGVLLGLGLAFAGVPHQAVGQPDVTTRNLVTALRILNTAEYSYRGEAGRFADREALLAFLEMRGTLRKSPIDLENPTPYALAITTASDGLHYQITLQQPSQMNDKNTWCKTAAFSDDRGVIFLGQAIDCEAISR